MRIRYSLVVTLAGLLLLAGSALAQSQLTLGSSSQSVSFYQNGELALGACNSTSCTLSGTAYFDAEPASRFNYVFTTTLNGGQLSYDSSLRVNSGPTTTTFSFMQGSVPWLTADVTWTYIVDSTRPQLNAVFTNLSVSSDASDKFEAVFGSSQAAELDMATRTLTCTNLAPGKSCTLAGILSSGSGAAGSGTIRSGELIPSPEPASLALLGTGLLVAGGTARRRWKK